MRSGRSFERPCARSRSPDPPPTRSPTRTPRASPCRLGLRSRRVLPSSLHGRASCVGAGHRWQPTGGNASDDPSTGVNHRFVFPHADDPPSRLFEDRGLPAIALACGFDLRLPEFAVGARQLSVLGTAMPEAAIDEHGKSTPCKGNVRSNVLTLDDEAEIGSKPQPRSMQRRPQRQLGAGVATAICPHRRGRVRTGRRRLRASIRQRWVNRSVQSGNELNRDSIV